MYKFRISGLIYSYNKGGRSDVSNYLTLKASLRAMCHIREIHCVKNLSGEIRGGSRKKLAKVVILSQVGTPNQGGV